MGLCKESGSWYFCRIVYLETVLWGVYWGGCWRPKWGVIRVVGEGMNRGMKEMADRLGGERRAKALVGKGGVWVLGLLLGLLSWGCGQSGVPEATTSESPPPHERKSEAVREFHAIASFLVDLEGRLRVANARTWRSEVESIRHAVGNMRMEIESLKRKAHDVRRLESWVTDLEGSLRKARAENWTRDVTEARYIAGQIRLELQKMRR